MKSDFILSLTPDIRTYIFVETPDGIYFYFVDDSWSIPKLSDHMKDYWDDCRTWWTEELPYDSNDEPW